MKSKMLSLLGLLTLLCTAWGQPRFTGYITFNNIKVAFASLTSSGSGAQMVQSRTYVGKDAIHRIIFNSDGSLYFGYDFVVESAAGSRFLVTMKPLSAEGLEKFFPGTNAASVTAGGGGIGGATGGKVAGQATLVNGGGGIAGVQAGVLIAGVQAGVLIAGVQTGANSIPVPLNGTISSPRFPAPQIIADGDVVTIDLLTNPQTGITISDWIKVASSNRILMQDAPSQNPDTSTLWAYGFDLIVDGKLLKHMGGGCSGKVIYFTGRSPQRFILSTEPYDGYDFRNVGIVDGNSIKFVWDGHNYELICTEPVLEGGAKSRLWVLFDGGADNSEPDLAGMATSPSNCGAADKIEYLFRKK